MTVEEAAAFLGINPNAVRSWLSKGYLADLEDETVEKMRVQIYRDPVIAQRRLDELHDG